jgi:uncharacterized protein YdaU (DUF1376 family)
MSSKPPAFPLYASDFDMDTGSWTCAQVGAYMRLLMYAWVNKGIPSSMSEMARIARTDRRTMAKMWSMIVEKKWIMIAENMYTNPRMEIEREKQRVYREKQSEYGKLGYSQKQEIQKKKDETMPRVAYKVDQARAMKTENILHHIEVLSREGGFSELTFSDFFNLFPVKKTIQTFDDHKKDKKLTQVIHFDGEISEILSAQLKTMNEKGAGIYLCVNETDGKGRKAENVIRVRAVYADLDGVPLEKTLPFNPTLIVESSAGKYHCYWFTDDTPLEGFTTLQKNIIRTFGSDPAVHDLSRVLRVPGFFHNKEDPFLSKVCGGSGLMFKYRELVEWFPPEKVEQWTAKRYQLDKKVMSAKGEYRGTYGNAGNGERNIYVLNRIGGMIKRGCDWPYIESEAHKEGRACSPPLDDREIGMILKSAQKYVRG